MRVHGHYQGAEPPDAELPQALRHEVLELDLLDLLDLGGLQRRRAAGDRKVDPAELLQHRQGVRQQPALADDRADAVVVHQPAREAVHARAGGGADADLLIASGTELAHVGGGMDEGGAAQAHPGPLAAVEHRDLGGVPDADDVPVDAQLLPGAQLAQRVEVGDREAERDLLVGAGGAHAVVAVNHLMPPRSRTRRQRPG